MKCNICGSEAELVDIAFDCPTEVTNAKCKPIKMQTVDIDFYKCKYCTHGQTEIRCNEEYYKNYQLIHNDDKTGVQGTYTKVILDCYENKFKTLANYAKKNDLIMDIGCGPGTLLECACQHFKNGVGIEPSYAQCQYAAQNYPNLKIINEFFGKSTDIDDESADAFISTQVFEHIEDVNEILAIAYNKLNFGAVGFIEVPNGQKTFNDDRYYDVFPEHINYFTPLSLAALINNAKFEIISISEEFNGNFLAAFIRKRAYNIGFTAKKQLQADKITEWFKQCKNVSVWGAGTKARSFLFGFKQYKFLHMFDNSSLLQGKYISDIAIPIEKPSIEKINENDLIVVFATNYSEEIISELRNEYLYKGKITAMY